MAKKKQLKNALALNIVKRKRYITEQGLQLAGIHRPFEIDSLQNATTSVSPTCLTCCLLTRDKTEYM